MPPPSTPVIYRSRVCVDPLPGRAKRVELPLADAPVVMGVNKSVAAHYGIADGSHETLDTTLDYLVASVADCMTGTFEAMLQALGHEVEDAGLRTTAEADIESVDGVMRVRRIHLVYDIRTSPGPHRGRFEAARAQHVDRCPVGSSVRAAIQIDPDLRFADA